MATRRGQTRQNSESPQDVQQPAEGVAEGQALDQQSLDNLQSQLTKAIQPVINNLQQQLSATVRNLAEQPRAGAEGEQPVTAPEPDLSSISQSLQTAYESIAQVLRSIWEWIVEMVRRFGDQVAEAIGNFVGFLVQRAIKSAF